MKRLILATSTMFLLTAGLALAQDPLNTTAPGPTQETKPGQTNNDFPNPGHPVPSRTTEVKPVTENATTEGTATESMQRDQTTATATGTMSHTDTMDKTSTTTTTPTATTTDTTATSTATTNVHGTTGRLPRTGSELPLVALLGLTSLAGFAVLRASRNA